MINTANTDDSSSEQNTDMKRIGILSNSDSNKYVSIHSYILLIFTLFFCTATVVCSKVKTKTT